MQAHSSCDVQHPLITIWTWDILTLVVPWSLERVTKRPNLGHSVCTRPILAPARMATCLEFGFLGHSNFCSLLARFLLAMQLKLILEIEF
ncbi:hypothetical protein A2U01_0034608 [Trifolium medium]|uniref:Uncharacterized protein n=1 Tax=Trifolium medium TaxID=97028 RepID=A0A392PPX9_9FABA|nr:hypothetical protein [Trifolium medium]